MRKEIIFNKRLTQESLAESHELLAYLNNGGSLVPKEADVPQTPAPIETDENAEPQGRHSLERRIRHQRKQLRELEAAHLRLREMAEMFGLEIPSYTPRVPVADYGDRG